MMKGFQELKNRARTFQGRKAVASSIVLAMLWYVLSVLPINRKETDQIQRVINNYMNNHKDIQWDDNLRCSRTNRKWLAVHRSNGGHGLTPVEKSIETQRLRLLRNVFIRKEHTIQHGWIQLGQHMEMEPQTGWANSHQHIVLWIPSTSNLAQFPVGWMQFLQWWQETWTPCLEQECRRTPNSMPISRLAGLPVWNCRQLFISDTIQICLWRSPNGIVRKPGYNVYRELGFKMIKEFLRPDKTVVTSKELRQAIQQELSQSAMTINHVTAGSCTVPSKHFSCMWATAKQEWLMLRQKNRNQVRHRVWAWYKSSLAPFTRTTNKMILETVARDMKIPHITTSIETDMISVLACRPTKPATMTWLALTRKDLLLLIKRNILPLLYKRQQWGDIYKTKCALCEEPITESATHLLWECEYARTTWDISKWHGKRKTALLNGSIYCKSNK